MKASELIQNAFFSIGRSASEQSVQGFETDTAISYLNSLMDQKSHLSLGYTTVTSGSDDITAPSYAYEWMRCALALKLSATFGTLESYVPLNRECKDAYATVLLGSQRILPPQLNGNTPLGSGNKEPGRYGGNYYPETDNGVLSEVNQTIVTEDS